MTALRYFAAPAVGVALFVTGCASERHREIPASAQMKVEGDRQLTFTAPDDGRVYIYDQDGNRMVYQGTIERGSVVVVDPRDDRITLDGRTIVEKEGLSAGNNHRIFFKEEDLPGRVTVPAGSRIEVQQERAPRTEIEIKEDQPETRIEVKEEPDNDTRIEIKPEDSDSTKIEVKP